MIPKLSDAATEADWSFTERTDVMEALARKTAYLARRWRLDPDDLLQEAYLWLAVRPKIQALDIGLILQHITTLANDIREKKARSDRREVPLEERGE